MGLISIRDGISERTSAVTRLCCLVVWSAYRLARKSDDHVQGNIRTLLQSGLRVVITDLHRATICGQGMHDEDWLQMHFFVIGTMASHICFWMTCSYQIPPSLVACSNVPARRSLCSHIWCTEVHKRRTLALAGGLRRGR